MEVTSQPPNLLRLESHVESPAPKGLDNKAQGQRHRRATLGDELSGGDEPQRGSTFVESLYSGRFTVVQPFQGWGFALPPSQGALTPFATLGFDV